MIELQKVINTYFAKNNSYNGLESDPNYKSKEAELRNTGIMLDYREVNQNHYAIDTYLNSGKNFCITPDNNYEVNQYYDCK